MFTNAAATLPTDPVPNPVWRNVRSAPKPGPILARIGVLGAPDPSRDRVCVASWSQIENCWRDTSVDIVEPIYPTAWAPIPPFYLDEEANG
jgi:hypothetical protein